MKKIILVCAVFVASIVYALDEPTSNPCCCNRSTVIISGYTLGAGSLCIGGYCKNLASPYETGQGLGSTFLQAGDPTNFGKGIIGAGSLLCLTTILYQLSGCGTTQNESAEKES
jgi:hypothetical protein